MSPNLQKLILVTAFGVVVCGVWVRREYPTHLIKDAEACMPKPAILDPSISHENESAGQSSEKNLTAMEDDLHADVNEPANSSEIELFRNWLDRYMLTKQDLHRLRNELEMALARLPDEGGGVHPPEDISAMEAIRRAEKMAGTDYRSLMDQLERFIEVYPQSRLRADANALYANYAGLWDENDFREVGAFSHSEPENFAPRIARYQEYVDRHGAAGSHVAEARKAIDQIRVEWSEHEYRLIYEFLVRYPNDVGTVATWLRRYLDGHPESRHRGAAEQYLARFEKAAQPGEYHVRVKSGKFARSIGRTFSFGPDLAVDLDVAGVRVGRTPIVANAFEPFWNYEFPQKIRWRLGDPIRIRVTDFDYSNRTILRIEPPPEDPLAMRFLSGPITADGHTLVFESDFQIPQLPAP